MSFADIDIIKKYKIKKRASIVIKELNLATGFLEELSKNQDLLRCLEDVLKNKEKYQTSDEEVRWVLLPLGIYQERYLSADEVCDFIYMKMDTIYNTDLLILNSITYDDSVEKAVCMTKSHSKFEMFLDYYLHYENTFRYIVQEMPYLDFIKSIGYEDDEARYMRKNFASFLKIDSELLDNLVRTNILWSQVDGPALDCNEMGVILSALEKKHLSSDDFQDLLHFLYQTDKSQKEKAHLFPVLVDVCSQYSDNLSFIKSLKCIPDTFFEYLDGKLSQQREAIYTLFEDELVGNSNLFSNLAILDKRKLSEVFRESMYDVLFTGTYEALSPEQKGTVVQLFDGISDSTLGCDIVKNIHQLFDKGDLLLENIQDLQTLEDTILFISDTSEEEYEMRVDAISIVHNQLDARYLYRYLWYLENSNLTTKEEYKAHCAYFGQHSIDEFFQDLNFCDGHTMGNQYQQRILTLVTDDEKKKKQQLRFVSKANPYMFPKDKERVLNVLEYSDDVSQIKSVVDLTTNPIFQKLSPILQSNILESIEPTVETDIMVTNFGDCSIFENLPDSGFVKCKGRGVKGPVEVFIGRSQK